MIRNFELVGRVNLDQLELLKEKLKETSGSEEEEREEAETLEEEEEVEEDEMADEQEKMTDGRQEEPSHTTDVTGIITHMHTSHVINKNIMRFVL